MAGIGFQLKHIFDEKTFTSMVRGFLYSTIISAGPWLLSVICLAILGVYSIPFLEYEDRQTFLSTVVYMYALAMVGTGAFQLTITRYLSDYVYIGKLNALSETFLPVLMITFCLQVPVGAAILWNAPLVTSYKISGCIGLLVISLIWQSMIFLSAAKDYRVMVLGFVLGTIISIGGGLGLGYIYGLSGYMNGFILGQMFILSILIVKIIGTFGLPTKMDFSFGKYFKRYPELILIGVVGNIGIWIDKILFGLSEHGIITANRFPTYNHYDSSMFLAFTTTVPAMALFLARTETSFATVYREYYDAIFFHQPYKLIIDAKRKMINSLIYSFLNLAKLQGLVTFACIYFAEDILRFLNLPFSQTAMFRYGLLGSFMQIFLIQLHVVLLYFDLRGTVMWLILFFAFSNTILTSWSINLGFPFFGSGFAAAIFLSLMLTVVMLYLRMANLEYLTFAGQKMVGQTYVHTDKGLWHIDEQGRYIAN